MKIGTNSEIIAFLQTAQEGKYMCKLLKQKACISATSCYLQLTFECFKKDAEVVS